MDLLIPFFTGIVVFLSIIEILAASIFIISLLTIIINEKRDQTSLKMIRISLIFFISIFIFFLLLNFLDTKLDWKLIKAMAASSHLLF